VTWEKLLDSWRPRQPEALFVKGKGCDWLLVEQWRYEFRSSLVWSLNADVHQWTDLQFDVHAPRHHNYAEHVPQMVHWSLDRPHHPWQVAFPIERMPRRKLGCTTAYMLALAWLLLDTWPALKILAPGCDYNGTPSEREAEKFSILYWLGRIEEKTKRRVKVDQRSRLLVDEDYR
jgi:hypothetical protein